MIVTLYTDISLNPDTKFASYAIWGICKLGKIFKVGNIPYEYSSNSNIAEMYGVYIGIQQVLNKWDKKPFNVDLIFVKTDNLSVCKAIWPWSCKPKENEFWKLREIMLKELEDRSIKIRVKHIKAHINSEKKNKYYNSKCDKISREYRKKIENRR